jgi:hypothetical protein
VQDGGLLPDRHDPVHGGGGGGDEQQQDSKRGEGGPHGAGTAAGVPSTGWADHPEIETALADGRAFLNAGGDGFVSPSPPSAGNFVQNR